MSVFGRIVEISSPSNDEYSLVTLERKFCFHTRQKILSIRNDELKGFDVNAIIKGTYDKDDSLSELSNLEYISIRECTKCGCESEDNGQIRNPQCCRFFPEITKQYMQLWEKYGDAGDIQLRLLNKNGEQFISNWINDDHYLFKKLTGLKPLEFYNIVGLVEDEHVQSERTLVNAIELMDVNA